jgi:glutathione S-transferase
MRAKYRIREMERLTLYGSFTSSSSYKPMLYLALARLPFSFRTVNLKYGVQKEPPYLAINRWGVVPSLRHRGLTILQSNVILDYLARETGISKAPPNRTAGGRANGCPGRPITSPRSPRCATRRVSARPIPR